MFGLFALPLVICSLIKMAIGANEALELEPALGTLKTERSKNN